MISDILKKRGYTLVEVYSPKKYSFNIIAKKADKVLIIRLFKNIDSCRKNIAIELKKLAYGLSGIPFIVGLYTRCEPLLSGIIYKRFGIFATNPHTFKEIAEGKKPIIYAERGGLFVKINGKKLREIREIKGLSLGQLAKEVGVSRRTIYGYEKEEIEATLEIAIKLEKILGTTIIKPIDLSNYSKELEKEMKNLSEEVHDPLIKSIKEKATSHGYTSTILRKAPFDIIAFREDENRRILIKTVKKKGNIDKVQKEIMVSIKIANMSDIEMVVLPEEKNVEKSLENLPSRVKLVSKDSISEIFK